jgi:hypothetical protein
MLVAGQFIWPKPLLFSDSFGIPLKAKIAIHTSLKLVIFTWFALKQDMPKAKKQCMVLFFSRTFFGVHFMAC